jgi:mRNA interferase RelE/StbE
VIAPRYTVEIEKSAEKQIDKLPAQVLMRVFDRLTALQDNPRPRGVEKLTGFKNYYRIRIGKYRIIYSIKDEVMLVLVVRASARKDIYRDL